MIDGLGPGNQTVYMIDGLGPGNQTVYMIEGLVIRLTVYVPIHAHCASVDLRVRVYLKTFFLLTQSQQ